MTGDSVLDAYFLALERLKSGNTIVMPVGSKITNDAVSLEAGRAKGSIKRSRGKFSLLIEEITKAAQEQKKASGGQTESLVAARTQAAQWRRELDAALAREVSLLRELLNLKRELALLKGGKVVPIRGIEREGKHD